ncbi:hypothetical protein BDW02DRAFT_470181, partial [Decorospora gaudefroyi]
TIHSLPDELLLEILRYLIAIRSFETQSTAFLNKREERARQCENRVRQLALYSLCFTSRNLRRVATPILYSSFTGSTTSHGLLILKLFHRTVSNSNNASGSNSRLTNHLLYVENRLADHLGNSLSADIRLAEPTHMVQKYFYLLSDIVRRAPNLQHLCVTNLESKDVSFWKYILPGQNHTESSTSTSVAGHGLCKLQALCVQVHTTSFRGKGVTVSFRDICSSMTLVPSLSDFRASTVTAIGPSGPSSSFGNFKSLQRLELTQCVLDFDFVIDIWSACEGLRHVVCAWAYLDCPDGAPSDLYPGLLRHAETLETLHLDLREVRFDNQTSTSPPPQPLGTL